ncbi:hypothetical protein Patl1_22273 [Pistacia atlantica]|uniref:Uncharacterized protein n=1 Tax=Pistacia atlantica TaxID=434234 RepID=A0ACC0ZZ36_9ROSI|nr:hypothetical protein Patl1_22273 [Pistacia atlantica]
MELQSLNFTSNNTQNPINDLPKHAHSGKQQEQEHHFFEDMDSTCSTPYVSAPSSPGRGSEPVNGGFYYSAPASPMHFALTASYSYPVLSSSSSPDDNGTGRSSSCVALGFEFGSGSGSTGSMSSADELFLNGKIRPMKLSSHLERPQVLAPLLDLDEEKECNVQVSNESNRGRDLRVVRDKSIRRRTRSLSPLRSISYDDDDVEQLKSASCLDKDNDQKNGGKNEQSSSGLEATTTAAASLSASSSRSSSAGRSSKRWVFLKDFLYRSKSEGRSTNKFWSTISFSPVLKEKKSSNSTTTTTTSSLPASKDHQKDITNQGSEHQNSSSSSNNTKSKGSVKKPVNGIGKRRMPPSPHELHYTANRAQAEEMKKKTFLPYRQGLLGCLGFSSKGYGAMNGIARAWNPVSSR